MKNKLKILIFAGIFSTTLCTGIFGKTQNESEDNKTSTSIEKTIKERDDEIIAEIVKRNSYEDRMISHEGWIYYTKTGPRKNIYNQHIFRIKEDGRGDMSLGAAGEIIRIEDEWIYFNNIAHSYNSLRNGIYKMKLDGSEKTEVNYDSEDKRELLIGLSAQGILIGESKTCKYIAFDEKLYKVKMDKIEVVSTVQGSYGSSTEDSIIKVDGHLIFKGVDYLYDINLEEDEINKFPSDSYGIGDYHTGEDGEKYLYFSHPYTEDGENYKSELAFLKIGEKEIKTFKNEYGFYQVFGGYVFFTDNYEDNFRLCRSSIGEKEYEGIIQGDFYIDNLIDGWLYLDEYSEDFDYESEYFRMVRCRVDGSDSEVLLENFDDYTFVKDGIFYVRDDKTYKINLDGSKEKFIGENLYVWSEYGDYLVANEYNEDGEIKYYLMDKDGSKKWNLGEGNLMMYEQEGDYLYFYDWVGTKRYSRTMREQIQDYMDKKKEEDKYKGKIYKYNMETKKMEWEKEQDYNPPKFLFDASVGTNAFLEENPLFDMKSLDTIKVKDLFDESTKEKLISIIEENTDMKLAYKMYVEFDDYKDEDDSFQEKLYELLSEILVDLEDEKDRDILIGADGITRSFLNRDYYRVIISFERVKNDPQ